MGSGSGVRGVVAGFVTEPGKFEGQATGVPVAYGKMLEGWWESDGEYDYVEVDEDLLRVIPELEGSAVVGQWLVLRHTEQGFCEGFVLDEEPEFEEDDDGEDEWDGGVEDEWDGGVW